MVTYGWKNEYKNVSYKKNIAVHVRFLSERGGEVASWFFNLLVDLWYPLIRLFRINGNNSARC